MSLVHFAVTVGLGYLLKHVRRLLPAIAMIAGLACADGRDSERAAEVMGEVNIDPRGDMATIAAIVKLRPRVYEQTDIAGAAYAEFGGALVVLQFAGDSASIADTSRPMSVAVHPPFRGRLLGVRLADSVDQALTAIQAYYPEAIVKSPRPGHNPGEYEISLDGPFELAREVYKFESDEMITLKFHDSRYWLRQSPR